MSTDTALLLLCLIGLFCTVSPLLFGVCLTLGFSLRKSQPTASRILLICAGVLALPALYFLGTMLSFLQP